MATATIDHATLVDLAGSPGFETTHVVAQRGGWTISIRQGDRDRVLTAQRSREARVFRRMETLVTYLRGVGIARFEVDAAAYDPDASSGTSRPDRAEALRGAHGAAAHDGWFRAQVRQAIAEADGADPGWVDQDAAKALWARQREKLKIRDESSA